MATKLDKPLIRDTGLTNDNGEVLVMLLPTATGGSIVFKEKGKHGKGMETPLSDILNGKQSVVEEASEESSEVIQKKPRKKEEISESEFGMIRIGDVKTRLMILDGITTEVQCKIFKMLQEIQQEQAEDLGVEIPVQLSR